MKIIKKNKGWNEALHCVGSHPLEEGCNSLLLVEQNDLFTMSSTCLGETEVFLHFQCPLCGAVTNINPNSFKGVWSTIPDRQTWMKEHPNHVQKSFADIIAEWRQS